MLRTCRHGSICGGPLARARRGRWRLGAPARQRHEVGPSTFAGKPQELEIGRSSGLMLAPTAKSPVGLLPFPWPHVSWRASSSHILLSSQSKAAWTTVYALS